MTTRIVLTSAQREQIDRGRFVRVTIPSDGVVPHEPGRRFVAREVARSVLVGRVSGEWRAYENECKHRALPLDLGASSPMSDDGEYLLCHQHGALYALHDGRCILGPCAGERLTPVSIEPAADGGAELVLGSWSPQGGAS